MENISSKIQDNNTLQNLEIKTVDQMSEYIESLQYNASSSVSSALAAQLQVIKYINSPDLTNSTFDLLFKNLDLSLKSAENEIEKIKMREVSQLMIHNYIFFANAKLEYSITKNKEAGKEVLKDATRELLKSSATVIRLAEEKIGDLSKLIPSSEKNGKIENASNGKTGDTQKKGIMGEAAPAVSMTPMITVAASIFVALVVADYIEKITKEGGIWDKAVDWTFAALKNKKDKENFIITIEGIMNKLDKYHHIIGKSNLMSDIIDRYSENVISLKIRHLEEKANLRKTIFTPILIIISILIAIVISIVQVINKGFNGVKSLISKDTSIVETHFNYYWLVLFSIIILGFLWISIPRFQLNSKLKTSEKRYKLLSQKFLEF